MIDMFKGMKLVTAIVIIIALVSVGSTIVLYTFLAREKAGKATLQDKLAEVMKERKKLSLEIEELKLIKGDLEVKLSGMETETKMLRTNYETEKSQNDVIRLELSKRTEDARKAEADLTAAKSEKERLQEMLESEKTKYNKLKERVDKLVEVKDVLEEKVREIINKQGIELERIVVKAEGELEGKVLVVNRDFNFIVVNIGVQDDIEIGTYLTVFRGGKYIGEAQVEKIYDTMSAATIVKEVRTDEIMVDDNVIIRSN